MTAGLAREIQELRLLMGSPRDPEGFVFAQLGTALLRDGEVEEALSVLKEGVERHPHFTPGHLALGWAAQESGDLDAALESYRRTIELDPDNPHGLFGAGRLMELRGDAAGAAMIREAAELDGAVQEAAPSLPAVSTGLADLPFMTLGELAPEVQPEIVELPDAALASLPFLALSELAPEDGTEIRVESNGGLSSLPFKPLSELAPEGDVGAADPEVPDATPLTRTMAELFVQQGHLERALEVYRELLRRSPGDARLEARVRELEGTGSGEATGMAEDVPDLHFAAPEPSPSSPSPYDWEDEEGGPTSGPVPPGSAAADYFGGLLSWSASDDREGGEDDLPLPSADPGQP